MLTVPEAAPPMLERQPAVTCIPWFTLLAAAMIAIGVFARFYHLGEKFYWRDETATSLHLAGHSRTDFVEAAAFDNHLTVAQVLNRFQQLRPDRGIREVLMSLAVDDPKHSPLYYALLYAWAKLFGSSPAVVRCLSAVIGVLSLPLVFWFCMELFERRRIAWMATALFAISPIQVLYAQEAREYALWIAFVLLSSTLLLRAMRRPTRPRWMLYAASLLLGLLSHNMMLVVLVAHALYLLGCSIRPPDRSEQIEAGPLPAPGRSVASIRGFVTASLMGLSIYAVWGSLVIMQFWQGRSGLGWIKAPMPAAALLVQYVQRLGAAFFDLNRSENAGSLIGNAAGFLVLALFIYSLYALYRRTPRRTWLFIITLAATFTIPIVGWDLLRGGFRCLVPRYALPLFVMMSLSVGWLLARGVDSPVRSSRWVWRTLTALIFAVGLGSLFVSSRADRWWTKGEPDSIHMAELIRRSPRPMVLSSLIGAHSGGLLTLCHMIPGDTVLRLVESETQLPALDGASGRDLFFIKPSLQQQRQLRQKRFTLSLVDAQGELWRITPPLSPHP
jgi:uncharacterized membrane protein